MSLAAGRLRHRVRIEMLAESQASNGAVSESWVTFADNVPAAIEPLSAREFIAAQQAQSEVTARIVIRYRPGVTAKMRIVHGGRVYNIAGVLPDKESGREYLTMPVSEGVNAG